MDLIALPSLNTPENRPPSRFSVGQTRLSSDGYAKEWNGTHWVVQHRRVMEEVLGRSLAPGENVHHINGVRDDNRPENLELWFRPQPSGQRVEQVLDYVVSVHADELRRRLSLT